MDNDKIIIAWVVVFIALLVCGIFILNPGHAKADSRIVATSNSTLYDGDSFSIKLIKKFRYLSVSSTKTLIQSLFFDNYKIFRNL